MTTTLESPVPAINFGPLNKGVITVTYAEIRDAIIKNGFEHIRGSWFTYGYGNIVVGACVLGQGARNLGVYSNSVDEALNEIYIPKSKIPINVRNHFGDKGAGLGTILIEMNDSYKMVNGDMKYNYSWKQMVNYLRVHIKDHLEETVELSTYNYAKGLASDN